MGVKEKYNEVSQFIKDNVKLVGEADGEKRFQMNQEHYTEYLTDQGITKDTIKQIAEANSNYNNGTIVALNDLMKEDKDVSRVTINTRTPNGVLSTRMTRSVDTRTPKTGEEITKYGVVSIKWNLKSRMDKDLLAECAAEIERASR